MIGVALLSTGCVVLFLADRGIARAGEGRIHARLADVPARDVAVVLGADRYTRGRINTFYRARVEAAAELYHAGKVRGLLISGDNSRADYNEPRMMKDDLVALGVPGEHITLDHARFRTLDSMVRARRVFGVDRLVVVTQRFHCERAIYIARQHGIDAVGFAASDTAGLPGLKVRAREVVARAKAWLDVNLLAKEPKFLGPPETVALR